MYSFWPLESLQLERERLSSIGKSTSKIDRSIQRHKPINGSVAGKQKGASPKRSFQRFGTEGNFQFVEMVDNAPAQILTQDEYNSVVGRKGYKVGKGDVPLLDKGAKKRLKARQAAQAVSTENTAAPSEARLKRGGLAKADIKTRLEAQYGTPAEGYWDGLTEEQWYSRSESARKAVAERGKPRNKRYNSAIIRDVNRFPDFPDNEVERFSRDAMAGKPRARDAVLGIPHAAASENLWDTNLSMSGELVSKGNSGSTTSTDLSTARLKGVDVQDVMSGGRNNAQMSIGVWGNLDGNAGFEAFQAAGPNDTMGTIFDRAQEAGRGTPDKLMDPSKQWLIGHVRDIDETTNVMGDPSKGMYKQTPGYSEYAFDLEDARPKIKGMTKAQFEAIGGSVLDRPGQMRLRADLKKLQESIGQVGKIEQIIDTDVLEAIDELGNSSGIRRAGDVSYHAGLPIDGKDLRHGVREAARNWKGGLGLTALDGTSREVGVKVGQGDYTGAAAEFGKTYVIGAAAEKGFRAAGSALAKKLPGIAARVGTGSAGSGGLLTPVMATIGAVELADGLVEGFTGKDTIAHVNDGMVKPYYERTTGDKRSDEQIQSNLSGPKRVYDSGIPKHDKPQMSAEAVQRASEHLSKKVPQVKPEAPKPQVVTKTVTPTIAPTKKPGWQKALDQAGSWIKGTFGL